MARRTSQERWPLLRQTFQEARAGSREAFETLFDDVRRVVRHKVDKMTRGPIERKISDSDLVQITCMEAFLGFKDFKGETFDEFMGWLIKILFNNMSPFVWAGKQTGHQS